PAGGHRAVPAFVRDGRPAATRARRCRLNEGSPVTISNMPVAGFPGPGRPAVGSRRRPLVGLAAAAAVLALAACSGGSRSPASSPMSSLPSSAAAGSPTPSPVATGTQRSLLSGRVGKVDGRVLVVKMDNTPLSEPHAGIKVADVVYLEEVEGGLSRYAVVFSTVYPRSA